MSFPLRAARALFIAAFLLSTAASAQKIELHLKELRFGPLFLKDLKLLCPELHCSGGALSFEYPPFGAFSLAPLVFKSSAERILLSSQLRAFGGEGSLLFEQHGGTWKGFLALRDAQLSKVAAPWRHHFERLSGLIDFKVRVNNGELTLKLRGEKIHFDRADYTQALADGALEASFRLAGKRGAFEIRLDRGEGLYVPLYWDFQKTPVVLTGRFSGGQLQADIEQKGVLETHFRQQEGSSEIEVRAPLPAFFRQYIAPFLEGGAWEGFRALEGRLWGKLYLRTEGEALEPRFLLFDLWDGVLDDPNRRFGVRDLLLSIRWQRELLDSDFSDFPSFPVSLLAFRKGYILRLPIGETLLFFKAYGDDLKLAFPVEVPFVDGVFLLRDFQIQDARSPERQLLFSGELRDVSLEVVTAALGLPPFSGKVSGRIPRVVYHNRVLKLAGQVVIEIFDGRVVVEKMELIDPFGTLPQLKADLRFENLNLEKITKRFDFGAIGGTLNGYVKDLYLVQDKIVSFDAWFETPENDLRSHYITQRAVENLVKLSGVTGAVTRFYLGFLKWFYYDRIGFGCRLRRGVCEIRSFDFRPDGGFYLIRGSPFKWPRIDVIGYHRIMDWKAFLARLKRVVR